MRKRSCCNNNTVVGQMSRRGSSLWAVSRNALRSTLRCTRGVVTEAPSAAPSLWAETAVSPLRRPYSQPRVKTWKLSGGGFIQGHSVVPRSCVRTPSCDATKVRGFADMKLCSVPFRVKGECWYGVGSFSADVRMCSILSNGTKQRFTFTYYIWSRRWSCPNNRQCRRCAATCASAYFGDVSLQSVCEYRLIAESCIWKQCLPAEQF